MDSLDERIVNFSALSYLDPRINSEDPLKGMMPILGKDNNELFRIGKFPVTNMEFARFMESGGYSNKDLWDESGLKWLRDNKAHFPRYWRNYQLSWPNYPVVGINLFETRAYCRWLSASYNGITFTLPGDEEWDIAAHGLESDFHDLMSLLRTFADENKLSKMVEVLSVYGIQSESLPENSLSRAKTSKASLGPLSQAYLISQSTEEFIASISNYMASYKQQLEYGKGTPVGAFEPNEQGCFDMFGNVWEWTEPVISYGETGSSTSPMDVEIGDRVIVKGGAWTNIFSPIWTILGGWFDPYIRYHRLGFRICARFNSLDINNRALVQSIT
jgi:formylglycine-generating enzyme required for sulfatase activity